MTPVEGSLLEYPTAYPLKIMGRREPGFAQTVMDIVQRHAPGYETASVEMRASRKGKYLSLTVTIEAQSREQLDALYRDLCDHPGVVMVL